MIEKIKSFWNVEMWDDRVERNAFTQWSVRQLRLLALVLEEVKREKILLHAYALTYTALLALIPLLALVISAFQGFGKMGNILKDKIRPYLIRNLLPETSQSVYSYLEKMISNVSFESLGIIGVLGVIYTALSALRKTEDAFNDIMHKPRTSSILSRFAMYWSMLTLGPLLLGASFSLEATAMKNRWVQKALSIPIVSTYFWQLAAILLTCVAFWMIYKFVPAQHIKFRSALYGGVLAGIVWEILRLTYYTSLSGSFRWHTIYGTLAILPITLIWLYMTWLIVIVGAVVTYCHQNLDMLSQAREERPLSHRYHERLVCAIMLMVVRRFLIRQGAITANEISRGLGISPRLTDSLFQVLIDGGFVNQLMTKDDESQQEQSYQPARDPSTLTVSEVLRYVRELGNQEIPLPDMVLSIEQSLLPAENAMHMSLNNLTFANITHEPIPLGVPSPTRM